MSKQATKNSEKPENLGMKALEHNISLASFEANCKFTKDFGVELLRGAATDEHIEVLEKSIQGVKGFIEILESAIEERPETSK